MKYNEYFKRTQKHIYSQPEAFLVFLVRNMTLYLLVAGGVTVLLNTKTISEDII